MMKKKMVVIPLSLVAIIILLAVVNQFFILRKAHSTFEDYYAFRGCVQLLSTTTDSGTCKTKSGQTIKIVEDNNKWYLDGDLPWGCLGKICFGP